MNKNIKTLLILVVVGVLGYVVYSQMGKDNSSLSDEALSDFAVTDTSSVDVIKLSDTEGYKMAFKKESNVWVLEDGQCVQQHMIEVFLETFKYIAVKSPVPAAAVSNINEQIMKHHKKVEIFQNGNISKTWYVGNPTQDHLGTYMLLKDAEKGKSPEPFILPLYKETNESWSCDSCELLFGQEVSIILKKIIANNFNDFFCFIR